MKLLVIILCLLSERFLTHSFSYKRFDWFNHYYLRLKNFRDRSNLPKHSGLELILIIAPVTVLFSFLYLIFDSILFGLFGFIIHLLVFYYCLGPKNPFYPFMNTNIDAFGEEYVGSYLAGVNNQLFAVIFWYLIGGPIALLLYRLISISQNLSVVATPAKEITEALEWLPARLTVLLYLLVGNFQVGLQRFSHFIVAKPSLNHQMLSECGLLAVRNNEADEIPMPLAEQLVEHAVIVLVVFIALFTIAAWL